MACNPLCRKASVRLHSFFRHTALRLHPVEHGTSAVGLAGKDRGSQIHELLYLHMMFTFTVGFISILAFVCISLLMHAKSHL